MQSSKIYKTQLYSICLFLERRGKACARTIVRWYACALASPFVGVAKCLFLGQAAMRVLTITVAAEFCLKNIKIKPLRLQGYGTKHQSIKKNLSMPHAPNVQKCSSLPRLPTLYGAHNQPQRAQVINTTDWMEASYPKKANSNTPN